MTAGLQKILFTITMLFCLSSDCFAVVYTFQTEGDYSDVSKWDTYPGTTLNSGDTILIVANCSNINLDLVDGLLIVEEVVTYINVDYLHVYCGGLVDLKSTLFQIDIDDSIFYDPFVPVTSLSSGQISIINYGNGITNGNCMFEYGLLFYDNYGNQTSDFLECFNGSFMNSGVIEVNSDYFFLNCELDLFDGTIESFLPFTMTQYGPLVQFCSFCTATINNIEELEILGFVNLDGNVILNAPE